MHTVHIHNASGHEQTFEVHGWNNGKNITVKANSTYDLKVDDSKQTSAAMIALHGGHEGEQAEMTKNGFGGNDFIDISNIVGAGGNMTIMQVGDISTLKGDSLFMQDCNNAWHKANAATKAGLKDCVHLDAKGNVVRIDAIKNFPKLEQFVRGFADGKTYVGVGSVWHGAPGHGGDDAQSSAGHGTKDLLITYSDGDAYPRGQGPKMLVAQTATVRALDMTAEPEKAKRLTESAPTFTEIEARSAQEKSAAMHTETSELSTLVTPSVPVQTLLHEASIQPAARGPGILLTNKSNHTEHYFFYNNKWNGNGTAGANFDTPLKDIRLASHQTSFISLPSTFKGRVQRGKLQPATWVEFQLDASNDHKAHGDISLEQGYDGAAVIKSSDGKRENGFTKDILPGAPAGAKQKRADGKMTLASTMGNWMGGPNKEAIAYEQKVVGQKKAYIVGGSGTDDVGSDDQVLIVDMY